ncbi:MAG TPA: Gfo/Idh/MocA family oxidoreductase [Chitinophagaceae bacterium]|nr:Gfo/Idh/MocA family oxidoreductase [Chitinophagaceae bacterium]
MQKIKTALLSYGMSGKIFHAPFIDAHPGFILTGAWERSKKNIQHDYPNTKSYTSLEELLDDDIDLVIVNTPSVTHFGYAKKTLLAHKHVVLEKPLTVRVSEGIELKEIAEQQNKILCPYQNRRWNSDYLTVKKIIDEGWLGDIVEVEIRYDRFVPSLSPKKHKETGELGTGVLYDLGAHLIDQALQLFGKPNALFADIASQRTGSLIDDYFEILLFYNNSRVRLKSGLFIREQLPGYMLFGKNGTFLKSRGDVQETDLIAGKKPTAANWGIEPESEQGVLHTEKDGKIIRIKVPTEKGDYMRYYEALYQSFVNGKPLAVKPDESIAVINVIEKSFESNRLKKVIAL